MLSIAATFIVIPTLALAQTQGVTQTYGFNGTGFIINTTGHIITNNHVIDHGCQSLTILTPRGQIPAKIIAQDKEQDLAVLQASYTPVRYAPLRWNITSLKPGEGATILGYPGQEGARGIEHINETKVIGLKGPTGEPHWINLTAGANHGNSGGPVLDSNGNVIGVITAKAEEYKADAAGNPVGEPINVTNIAITLNALKGFLSKHRINFHKSASNGGRYSEDTLRDRSHSFIVPILCSFTETTSP